MFKLFKRSKKDGNGQVNAECESSPEENGQANYDCEVSLLSDVGCHREINEDFGRYVKPVDPALMKKGVLAVVADGMGGHSAGEVASRMAAEVISRVYYESNGGAAKALKRAFEQANHEVYTASSNDESLAGMGTTCTALVLQNGSAICAHVGDTRLYLLRGGDIYLMTQDHSAVMELVKRGVLSLEEARTHPDKNVIVRALGSRPEVEVSLWDEPFPVQAGDRFLICSDGLYDLVGDDEIKQAAAEGDTHSACKRLIALARERGGYDNITVGILAVKGSGSADAAGVRQTREVEILQ